MTAVSGLEAFGLENKKMSKEFGKKFATGASVTKIPSGGMYLALCLGLLFRAV